MHISKETVHIAIAETSVIIRRGLSSTLESLAWLKAHIVEVTSMEGLSECMEAHSPDILIVNPDFCGGFSLKQMKGIYPGVCYVELLTEPAKVQTESPEVLQEEPQEESQEESQKVHQQVQREEPQKEYLQVQQDGRKYDAQLSVFADIEEVAGVMAKLSGQVSDEEFGQERSFVENVLSQREREIVVRVVRGLTNKEIADELFISVHTVVTHRKNISRKLQIHSAAGLTIYAIANKLIELKDLD